MENLVSLNDKKLELGALDLLDGKKPSSMLHWFKHNILCSSRPKRPVIASFHPYPFLLHLTNTFSSCHSGDPFIHLRSFQRTHALLLASGRKPDLAFASKLIHWYCRAGKTNVARKLFDEMPEKNVVSFSTMIYGYASNGFFAESLQLFSHMQELGICANSFTIVGVLVSSAGLGVSKIGEFVHGRIVKSGLEANPFVRTALLDCYAKCRSPMKSYILLQEMVEPSIVSCNAMIAGLVHNDLYEEALLLFKQLWQFGLVPNSLTMVSVIQSCIGYGSFRLCESMHGYVVKVGMDLDVAVMNSVFDMYLSFGNLEVAKAFFGKMAVMDVITWTNMMNFLLEVECATEALNLFIQMRVEGVDPDMVAMLNVITACARLGDLNRGRSVHNQIVIRGYGLELPVKNSLITMYSKCGDMESARMLFDRIENKSLVSWTAIISGYVQNGQPIEGLQFLSKMRKEDNLKLDSVTIVHLLMACSELSSFELSKQFHSYSLKSGLFQCQPVQNSLVAVYGKCGYVELGRRVFDEMFSRDTVSWNAMISSCGINGNGEAALVLFHDMEKSSEVPDSVTYLNVLTACSHSGLVDDGLIIFARMVREKKIDPRGEHCGCVVDMLARAGRLADAKNLVSLMSEEVSPNVWKALLGGSHLHNDVKLVETAAEKVFQMASKDSGHVVLLSNAYASVGNFGEVETLRSNLGKMGLTKNTGFSLVDSMPSDTGLPSNMAEVEVASLASGGKRERRGETYYSFKGETPKTTIQESCHTIVRIVAASIIAIIVRAITFYHFSILVDVIAATIIAFL
ncbi:putative pentatricopeptide repeat-containing protein At3g01580 [Phoenix dactylifera]|uniref:Pentatricopeptide repeat-containing protein At3g01580 n=1 Tax=Phoenix dactylifera TaxID=42345 RepID=A0A8B7MXC4_PHODC|nr:putative pentatricopeptide repeat-containing protein At3g01580 [Phoenix dactylifera]